MTHRVNLCPHRSRAMYRVVLRDGRTQVKEHCLDCGENPRGPGVWVGRSELRVPLEDLPLLADHHRSDAPAGPEQRTLFEETP